VKVQNYGGKYIAEKDQGDERNLVLIVLYENWVQERLDEPFTKEMAGK